MLSLADKAAQIQRNAQARQLAGDMLLAPGFNPALAGRVRPRHRKIKSIFSSSGAEQMHYLQAHISCYLSRDPNRSYIFFVTRASRNPETPLGRRAICFRSSNHRIKRFRKRLHFIQRTDTYTEPLLIVVIPNPYSNSLFCQLRQHLRGI